MKNGVEYFLNSAGGAAASNVKIYFDFSSTNNNYVYNVTGKNGYLNGNIINYDSNVWSQTGSVVLSGAYIAVSTTGDIDLSNITYAMVYEKTCSGGATLISTINTGYDVGLGGYNIGYEFGVTANNRLYFEYYSNSGPQVFTSSRNLSDKSSVFLNIKNNSVSFGDYNFFSSELNSDSFNINTNYIFKPTGINIGYNQNAVAAGYSYNKKFTGFVDEFLMFSPTIYNYELVDLNSDGFASDYVSGSVSTGYSYTTGITGYTTGITGFYKAVTGYNNNVTGTIFDKFGDEFSGYVSVPLTGTLYGTGVIALTGVSVSSYIINGPPSIVPNSGYIGSFGKSAICLTKKIDTGDFIDVNIPDYSYNTVYKNNLLCSYDGADNTFFANYAKSNPQYDFIVFLNGLAQNSGNYTDNGNIYSQSKILLNDYILDSNREFLFNLPVKSSDTVICDTLPVKYNTSYYIENFYYDINNNSISLPWPVTGYDVFFNGQKLISGSDSQIGVTAHYGTTSTGIYFKYIPIFSGVSGQLFALPRNFNNSKTGIGQPVILTDSRFYTNFSQVYLNGQRLALSQDYLELAAIDSNAGSGIFDIKTGVLYNNNQSF